MGFSGKDAIKKAISSGRGQRWCATKIGTLTPQAAGKYVTMYSEAGSPAAGATATGTWAALTAAAINFPDVSPKKRYLARAFANSTQSGTLLVYDRLGHVSISLASIGSKTVNAVLPSRYSSAETDDLNNIECWCEVTTATTVTAPVIRMNTYSNEALTGSRLGTSLTFPAAATPIGWMSPLPLQAGDKGVSAVANVEVQTAATVGVANILLLRKLAEIPIVAGIATVFTEDDLDLPRVYDGSSICFAFLATAASALTLPSVKLVAAYEE